MKKNLRKVVTLTILFILFSTSFLIPLSSSIIVNKNKVYNLDHNYDKSIFYLSGYRNGKKYFILYSMIDKLIETSNQKNNLKIKNPKEHLIFLENNLPFMLDEMKGISDSTGIKLERISLLKQKVTQIVRQSCTVLLATGPATKNNDTFLMQNIDGVFGGFIGNIFWKFFTLKLWVKEKTLNYKYSYFGIPGLVEIPIMNEKGLGWGGNLIVTSEDESRYVDEGPGIWGGAMGYAWNQLIMMTCKDVHELTTFYNDPLKSSTEYGLFCDSWCDKQGNILTVEHSHNHLIFVYKNSTEITNSKEGILWHTNHHQWLDPNLTGSIFPEDYPSSCMRSNRAEEILIENYGNITIDVCKSILRDHKGGFKENKKDSGDICRHPDKNNLGMTIASWIIQPKDLTVYYTNKHPCRSEYKKCDLSVLFN